MKLHKDGTLEGTPQEIAEYNRLMMPASLYYASGPKIKSPTDPSNPLMPNPLQPAAICGASTDIVQIQKDSQKKMKPWERPIAKFLSK